MPTANPPPPNPADYDAPLERQISHVIGKPRIYGAAVNRCHATVLTMGLTFPL